LKSSPGAIRHAHRPQKRSDADAGRAGGDQKGCKIPVHSSALTRRIMTSPKGIISHADPLANGEIVTLFKTRLRRLTLG
jgi:hypothetical protein